MTITTANQPAAETYPHYAAAYESQPDAGPATLRKLRERGWNAFQDLGLPTARRGNEPWKYTNAAPIARERFGFGQLDHSQAGLTLEHLQAMAPWQPDWRTLVFVDGEFAEQLSSPPSTGSSDGNPVVGRIADAATSRPALVDGFLTTLVTPESEGFAAVNTAFLQDGAAIGVPAGQDAGIVNVIYVTTERSQPRATYPRMLVHAAPNSRVTVIESYVGTDDVRYLTNAVTEVEIEEGATVEHYRLLMEGNGAYHVGVSRVRQHKDSHFSSLAIAKGAALGRNDFGVLLAGTGAECVLNGLYLTGGSQHIDNYINIDHAEPYGTSRLFYKGILDGQSRAVFGGNVTVRKDAQKTDAQQTDKNLLLSQDAEVDSKPSLLIYADDVKCGHGATAGHIDEDTVFYMRSRGLDLPTVSRILIHAFASEIIDTVALEPLRECLDETFRNAVPDADISLPIGGRS